MYAARSSSASGVSPVDEPKVAAAPSIDTELFWPELTSLRARDYRTPHVQVCAPAGSHVMRFSSGRSIARAFGKNTM